VIGFVAVTAPLVSLRAIRSISGLTSSPPFSLSINSNAVTPSPGKGGTPFTVANAFSSRSALTVPSIPSGHKNTQPAYIHQFTLMLEHAITNQLSLSAGYHGQSGHHLADYRNGNQLTLAQATIIAGLPPGTDTCDSTVLPSGGGSSLRCTGGAIVAP